MKTTLLSIIALVVWGAGTASACETAPKAGIQWYGTLEGGMQEAKKTGRPILLMSAAPQCHNISGVW